VDQIVNNIHVKPHQIPNPHTGCDEEAHDPYDRKDNANNQGDDTVCRPFHTDLSFQDHSKTT
jgi:hypothetical protein